MRLKFKCLIFAFGILPLLVLQARTQEKLVVRVDGLSCAYCAYSLEKKLQELDGVQVVTISLNNGSAEIRLAPENRQTLATIRKRSEDNGFTPKDAKVKLNGIAREKDGKLVIEVESGESYVLQPSAEAKGLLEQLRKEKLGKPVTVVGSIGEGKKTTANAWELSVTRIQD